MEGWELLKPWGAHSIEIYTVIRDPRVVTNFGTWIACIMNIKPAIAQGWESRGIQRRKARDRGGGCGNEEARWDMI